ncbi:MAG: class Ib ribonucleoside-diphosphate reductase assembly flavoprotein NrdI [Solibacillus sp.]
MIVFASRTGNVRAVVSKLGLPNIEMTENLVVAEPFLLMTYTDGLGDVPQMVEDFMQVNATYCKGIVASGNQNFGHALFAGSGDKLTTKYGIPLVCKMDLRGKQADLELIQSFYEEQVCR